MFNASIIGCGDYLRWQVNDLQNSKKVKVVSVYDIDKTKRDHYASLLNAKSLDSEDQIFEDPSIDIVMLFTPPWVRKNFVSRAVEKGKHIITTKPLASNGNDADEILETIQGNVQCAVFYRRTGNGVIETLKSIFDSGEIGKLSLYKEDWLHHYPQWNTWATDPAKNGGPFMDAMIHNLNIARYLMNDEVQSLFFSSENHAQSLKCNDTEFLKVNFSEGRSAYLFITWAADLQVFDKTKNEREHIGILQMATDQGWFVQEANIDGKHVIKASKEGEVKTWPVTPLLSTPYDEFADCISNKKASKWDILDAWKDIKILTKAMDNSNAIVTIEKMNAPATGKCLA